tara:strand:+ start:2973 stop:3308 length:336 start_codon:yes stop_codon:yes gene_type:complete
MKNVLGIIVAFLVSTILIFSYEEGRSLLQILFGFLFFIIPFTFIASFNSNFWSFIIIIFSIFFGYFSYKLDYYDLWIGVVLAAIIGLSIYFFRIKKFKVFSREDYKKDVKN